MFAANVAVGDYHANFNADIAVKWLRNRYIPWIKSIDPQVMSGVPGARLNGAGILPGCKGHVLRADGAPYHVATTTNLDPALGAIRFNPRQLTKDKLVDALTALGCHSLDVVHEYLVEASEGTMSSVARRA